MRLASALTALAMLTLATPALAWTKPAPIPMEAMVADPAMSQMQLSPDGLHLAALTSIDGQAPAISIWKTDSLSTAPKRFGIGGAAERKGVRFASITWVAADRLFVILQQPLTTGAGAENRDYTGLARIVDLEGKEWIEPLSTKSVRRSNLESFIDKFLTVSIVDQLPDDPRHILMLNSSLDQVELFKVDVYTGRGEKVMQLSERESLVGIVDAQGTPRVKQYAELKGADWAVGYQIYEPDTRTWVSPAELTYMVRSRRSLSPLRFDPQNPDLLLFVDNEGSDLSYVRGYSISKRAWVEKLFEHPQYEVEGVVTQSVGGKPTAISGFTLSDDIYSTYWADPEMAALHAGLQRQFPGARVSIGGKNGRHRIIQVVSSTQPNAYLLMTDDKTVQPLGVSNPAIDSSQLAPTQLVYYTARDGLRIPAFLTLPKGWKKGDAQLPTIIQPHGGPWGRNNALWGGGDVPVTQYFASRGFAVLQPQFRGSTGFGDRLWKAGDEQWGLAMQDDKDDGLAWLVSEGIADPKQALIYGFSYGGFAAMAAVVRDNPPYRCAISGAGVSSLERLGSLWRSNRIQRQLQGWTLKGMDPFQNASKATIPILIYHGDRDQTATLWHSERFAGALRGAGKPHKFVVIKDMPHGAITPEMRREEMSIVDDFIRNECGIAF